MARIKKKEAAFLTMFNCEKCGKQLLNHEYAIGVICNACRMDDNGIKREAKKKKTVVDFPALIDFSQLRPEGIVLESGSRFVNGTWYDWRIYTLPGNIEPNTEIINKNGVTIYHTGAPDISTTEGIEVLKELQFNSVIPKYKQDEIL